MSRIISFPQAFALHKGANYNLNAVFTGLPTSTLTAGAGFKFNQPAFQTPAANLYNSATTTYALGTSASSASAGLVYKFGGNLVDTAIKWTNGKSLGNWYQIQRHGALPTGGSVSVENGKLKITSGTDGLTNRSVVHDTLFQRNGTQIIPETSNSVVGWLHFRDIVNTTLYFKGYVERTNLLTPGTETIDPELARKKMHFVGFTYNHTAQAVAQSLDSFVAETHGFGFVPALVSGNYTWHAVVKAVRTSTTETDYVFVQNTNLSALIPQRLKVNFTNGVVTWFINNMETPIATQTILSIPDTTLPTTNAMYAALLVQKGTDNPLIPAPGVATLYVEEAATWREFPTGGKSGLIATLSLATNDVTLTTGNTAGLSVGMRLVKTSTGGGAFNAATTTNGTFIGAITNGTTFTVVSDFGVALNHATAGSITFDAGLIFAFNNFEDTNTEVTLSDTMYQNTGLQLLKKLK